MGSQLETEGGGMFSSERVRLSAKIETAAAELDDARRAVALKAAVWTEDIGKWTARLDMLTKGAGDEGPGWFDQLYAHDGGIVENSAPVTAVGASNTRMGKLSAGRSVLSANPSNAEVYVLTENEIAIELVTGSGDDMRPVPGVRVTVTDARDPASEEIIRTTDEKGRIILLSNLFIADEHRNLLLKVDVDGEARGYRSFGVEECRIKMGQSFKGTLVPLDDRPYVYSASFHGYDIMWQDFEMLYSDLNDYDFEIRVTTRNPGGEGLTPAPRFGYWKKDGGDWNYSKHIVEATAHEGNTYVFKGPWKRRISPWISKDQYPFFTLDARDDSAARQGLPEG